MSDYQVVLLHRAAKTAFWLAYGFARIGVLVPWLVWVSAGMAMLVRAHLLGWLRYSYRPS